MWSNRKFAPARRLALAIAALATAGLGWAQRPVAYGVVSGTITKVSAVGAKRSPLGGVLVRARNAETQQTIETRSAADGAYRLRVPAGKYDVFAIAVGHNAFAQRELNVAANAEQRVDAALAESLNEGTPGELPYLHLREEAPAPPKGPAPRTKWGRPDFTGVWYPGLDLEPETVPYLPWAAEYARTHSTADDPRGRCLPSGVARGQQMELTKFIQTPDVLVMLVEGAPPGFRQIFLDGRKHPDPLEPSWMGHSIGRWERETLVVETTGFNDRAWVDFNRTPQTEKLKVTERFRRLDRGHLDVEITVDDPGAYSRPWRMHRILTLAPSEEIHEYVCENDTPQRLVR